MDEDRDRERADAEAEVEREVRRARKFTPKEAFARLAGPGAMKGASPVSRQQQAEIEIGSWLRSHLADPSGALQLVLHRHLKGNDLLLNNPDQPLNALAEFCRHVVKSDQLVKELVREADVEWGRSMDERPFFERDGSSPHPSDPYTLESVRRAVGDVLTQLGDSSG